MNVTVLIPNSGHPNEKFNTTLNGVLYQLSFVYNFRYEFWEFTVKKDSISLFERIKVVQGVNLGELYDSETKLEGKFYIGSIAGDESDPSLNDFGKGRDKRLYYQYEVSV